MTKQELASKIWASTNTLRGNIELGTYKDYMLSLLFYKFLSDKEEEYLLNQGWEKEEFKEINENDEDTVKDCKNNIGYFIAYENLFSTWISKGQDYSVKDTIDGLNAFARLIGDSHKKVFSGIFDTLQSSISNLGSTTQDQTKALKNLLETINDIPTDSSQGYDTLGFIYEFLIGNFAANAGKKAGEFYTPHEVSVLMSEIVCNHLKDRESIKILDPTSGSGSLLLTIGKTFAKYSERENNVEYYAQEFIKSTYNLTRMNLIMRGILPNNIVVRNGDTLAKDWPFFDDRDPDNTYDPLYVDAVVSNPPYSQKWDPKNRQADPRFSSYGLAPKSRADYAFLLYDLYHTKPDGIAAIVLPHGVLFRGNEEKTIRERLIENNKIDAIIGLPANAFYGTGIPTILMILKQHREDTGVLFIDASNEYIKDGNKNRLQAKDIKRIADTYINREEKEGLSREVSKREIVENDYNLNIPRYIDSSKHEESWDIYSLMYGGIPNYEIDELDELWKAFPSLKNEIFEPINEKYSRVKCESIRNTINRNNDVRKFIENFHQKLDSFGEYLSSELLADPLSVNTNTEEETITAELFRRYEGIPLIDAYKAYQLLDDSYNTISNDLEIVQNEGFDAVRKVVPNIVYKAKDDRIEEVQEGLKGYILPFDIVQQLYLSEELAEINKCVTRLTDIDSEYGEILGSMTPEELDSPAINDDGTSFVSGNMSKEVNKVLSTVSTPEIDSLNEYLNLLADGAKKPEKSKFVSNCSDVNWNNMTPAKDGTYGKKVVTEYIKTLQLQFDFDEDSYESKIIRANSLMQEEKNLKKEEKEKRNALEEKTTRYIEGITNDEANYVLEQKWISPLKSEIMQEPDDIISRYIASIERFDDKYKSTILDIDMKLQETEKVLSNMLETLTGSDYDIQGLKAFKSMFGG